MRIMSKKSGIMALLVMGAMPIATSLSAQQQDAPKPDITVTGEPAPDPAQMTPGPEIKGFISAHGGDKVQVTAPDGTKSIIAVNETTRIKASKVRLAATSWTPVRCSTGCP
jgi:hypothetical protein